MPLTEVCAGRDCACQVVPPSEVPTIPELPARRQVVEVGHASSLSLVAAPGVAFFVQLVPPFVVVNKAPDPVAPHDNADEHDNEVNSTAVVVSDVQLPPALVEWSITLWVALVARAKHTMTDAHLTPFNLTTPRAGARSLVDQCVPPSEVTSSPG